MDDSAVIQSYIQIIDRISEAARRAGRDPGEVQLVAVSKGQSAAKMNCLRDFVAERGALVVFGESYVQEFRRKRGGLRPDFRVHFIGGLQRNKAKAAVELFDVVETVDSRELARAVNAAAAQIGKVQEVFLQVNVSADAGKHGVALEGAGALAEYVKDSCTSLRLCGLMTITRLYQDPDGARMDYRRLAELGRQLTSFCEGRVQLSMGMSSDFEVAIEEGATLVRVGSALFGNRN
ncbi:MAG: YggS family pyridoxal phosphate-dependent enzyme [Deltaproteobacteria bacterium]|nr:YggS family pyridoxal phosphate-dependent enzyme [Deltaproteobacteria bacterium]